MSHKILPNGITKQREGGRVKERETETEREGGRGERERERERCGGKVF